ncbi:type II secretion system protein [Ammonicoccus fulvus]|uniref:Type II secretion system protein n=1 Tax=Ammonicoccus fulvus TaxID=3138240 RepID=A0ABZ3FN59_9ACTN
MIGLALVWAVLAAALGVRPPARVPEAAPPGPPTGRSRVSWPWFAPAVGVGLAGVFGGTPAAVVALAAAIVAMTGVRMVQLRRRHAGARRATTEVSRACALLASELDLGKVPATALSTAAEDCPVLAPAAAIAGIGGDPVSVWRRQCEHPGQGGLTVLARAWQVATDTGAPLAPSLETVAAALRADEEVEGMVLGELAAPRMTGVLLAFLPAVGVALGYLIGGDPVAFLTGEPAGWACLLGGSALAAAGVLWTERLASQA